MAHTDPAFWLGTYTASGDGTAKGIVALSRQEQATLRPSFAAPADSPSWLTVSGQHPLVYAAEEFAGRVVAFRPDGTALSEVASIQLDAGACHLSVSPRGRVLIAACYGTGQVVWIPLDDDGGLGGAQPVVAEPSTDPYRLPGERDPHAHQSRWLPNGLVVTTDLGYDLVRVWRPTKAGLSHVQDVALPQGVGPRHGVWHESGHLHVVTEYSGEIFTLRFDDSGALRVVAGVRATADPLEDGDTGAEIAIGDRRDRLYAGIRGSNRISTIEILGDGSELRPISDVESGGNWPRHHIVDGPLLHVAHQYSGDVATHRLDDRTGIPHLVGTAETGTATCLAPTGAGA
ncbi:lactonase family protein [Paramicrobacterium agarici]|uniref:lactonase family protein n=1 Tax=Paramicrobacterium agarici TaxID=630514 RepID=UPI00114FBFA9|nr:beta-propeller fold lactonase family protein [Microbacterium agarici]TQO23350.1 6-phosphogluconolactonase (cycloisomerase 2 family) [Microbacterium agarici]